MLLNHGQPGGESRGMLLFYVPVFNGLRQIVETGTARRWMPNDLLPWEIVHQQPRRGLRGRMLRGAARPPAPRRRRAGPAGRHPGDHERRATTLAGLHFIAVVCVMLKNAAERAAGS